MMYKALLLASMLAFEMVRPAVLQGELTSTCAEQVPDTHTLVKHVPIVKWAAYVPCEGSVWVLHDSGSSAPRQLSAIIL
jgi:hypothetical protein